MKARAFCPGHISTFFSPRGAGREPHDRGSVGSGFCITAGVTTTVKTEPRRPAVLAGAAPTRVLVEDNGASPARLDLTNAVLSELKRHAPRALFKPGRIEVSNRYALPLGAGFGVSGGLALALALAANAALGLRLSRRAC